MLSSQTGDFCVYAAAVPLDFSIQIWLDMQQSSKVLYRGAFALLFYQGEGMICADRSVQGVCVRALAMSGDTLFRFFEQFEKLL